MSIKISIRKNYRVEPAHICVVDNNDKYVEFRRNEQGVWVYSLGPNPFKGPQQVYETAVTMLLNSLANDDDITRKDPRE